MDTKKLLEGKTSCTHCGSKNYDVNSVEAKDIKIKANLITFDMIHCDGCGRYFNIKVEYTVLQNK